jgi:hypothetical protein
MIDCYFCGSEYEPQDKNRWHQSCPICPTKWKVDKTYTIYDDEGLLVNAQIYIKRSQVISYPAMRLPGLMGTSYLQLGWDYQFRLDFGIQKTILTAINGDTFQKITEVTGFPITPENAEDKLSLYLTFS